MDEHPLDSASDQATPPENLIPEPSTGTEIQPELPALDQSVHPTHVVQPLHSASATDTTPVTAPAPAINVNQLTMNYTVVALVFLGVGILLGRLIFGGTGSNIDPGQLRSMINEAVAAAGGSVDQSQATLVDDDPTFGSATAPITIVEFSDFNCGFCTRFATETLPRLRETYGENIHYVYRDMPIIGGDVSVQSAIAAECANDQGKFWDFHNLLFSNSQARSQDAYVNFASELGLDTNTFTACLSDKNKSDEVMLDMLDGQGLDIRGTPAFYVNGRFISGAQPFEIFQTVINSELSKVGIQPPA